MCLGTVAKKTHACARAVPEQRQVQERRPPGGGELGVQPAVDRDVPEPGAGRDGVPAGRAGGGGAHPGRAHHLRRDVPALDGARHRARQAQEAGQGRQAAAAAERQQGVRRAQARVSRRDSCLRQLTDPFIYDYTRVKCTGGP